MSQEEQDATIGRVLRQKKDAEKNLAMLQAHAKEIGERWNNLATKLINSPAEVFFEGAKAPNTLSGTIASRSQKLADFNPQLIADLTNEIREITEQVQRLGIEANKLGF